MTPAGPKPGGAPEPPLFAGAVHGIRCWGLSEHGLLHGLGIGSAMVWSPDREPTTAHCLRACHPAPDPKCGCGLYALHPYAYRRPARHGPAVRAVTGIVEAWGRIEVHGRGFRAQRARPLVLLAPAPHLARPGELEELEAVSRRYELPIVQAPLPAHAREWCRLRELGLRRSVVGRLIAEGGGHGWVEQLGKGCDG